MSLHSLRGCRLLVSALFALGLTARTAPAEPLVTVTLDTAHPGARIPSDFSGLSFEVAQLLPGPNHSHYFRPGNRALLGLFRTLGIRNLRLGGNTSDRDAKQLPSEADFDSLFAFAKAAGVRIIYCLRLHDGNPRQDALTAKYILNHYAAQMDCFSIGQEPSAYPKPYSYADYREDWNKFADAIIATVPEVKFCGPSVHRNGAWARRFMHDFGHAHHVILIAEHLYPGGAGNKVATPEAGRDRMLSSRFLRVYQELYDSFVPAAAANGLPYRLEEVNNYYNGGAKGVSDTFAAALWGLDFMHWWAAHGAVGLNFHTGDRVAVDYRLKPPKYAAFYSTPSGYTVRPLGYGIKAFDLGGHGRIVHAALKKPGQINLTAYAVLGENANVYLTLINKDHGRGSPDLRVAIQPRRTNFAHAEVMYLTAPNQDVAATSGELLGGAKIQPDGSWNGTWSALGFSVRDGVFVVPVPAATAAIVRLKRD